MNIYIYKIYCEEEGILYIGSTNNIERRLQEHNKNIQIKKYKLYEGMF